MKNKMSQTTFLTEAIASLEKKSMMQKHTVENSFSEIVDELKPINIIKKSVRRLLGKGEKVRGMIAEKIFRKTNALPSPRIIKVEAKEPDNIY